MLAAYFAPIFKARAYYVLDAGKTSHIGGGGGESPALCPA